MKTTPLYYLASPYSHPKAEIRERRFDQACQYAARLMREGMHLFSPIAHGHSIAEHGLPTTFDFFQAYCENTLTRCDGLIVLQLTGWQESVGVQAEIEMAVKRRLPTRFVAMDMIPVFKEHRHG